MEEQRPAAPLAGEALKRAVAELVAEKEGQRWLISEKGDPEMKQGILDYLEGLDGDVRTPEEEYRRRLSLCKGCVNLNRGYCALCGCAVEIRAGKAEKRCPAIRARW